MAELKLFIMALYATQPDPEFMDVTAEEDGRIAYRVRYRDGEMHLSSPVGLAPAVELAATAEEAKAMGLEHALELWPRSEGWVGHAAAVSSRSLAESLREAFGPDLCGCFTAADRAGSESEEWLM